VKTGDLKSFGKEFSKGEIENYLDPFGFLNANERKAFFI
jgi:hypothetical protein